MNQSDYAVRADGKIPCLGWCDEHYSADEMYGQICDECRRTDEKTFWWGADRGQDTSDYD